MVYNMSILAKPGETLAVIWWKYTNLRTPVVLSTGVPAVKRVVNNTPLRLSANAFKNLYL